MAKLLRVVAREHGLQVAKLKTNSFNLLFGEMARAPPDCEPPFGGTVDEVGGRIMIVREICIGAYRFERRRSSTIAILANQCIDDRVFAKFRCVG